MAVYESYGKRTADIGTGSATPSMQEPAGFGSQYGYYTDRETGLLCLTHRYYDPGTGRFLNRDPIGYQGGVNLYGFAGGNPVNRADPSGLDKIYINDPNHYTPAYITARKHGMAGHFVPAYVHQKYVIDYPDGQNADANAAHALSFNTDVSQIGSSANQGLMKYDYLNDYVRNGTVGDYGKNSTLYTHSNIIKNPGLYWERRQAANFNLGVVGAALGLSLDTLLASGHGLRLAHSYFLQLHPQVEQDAIEDGYWYFYSKHPAQAIVDKVTLPAGIKFGYVHSSSVP